ncbi:MAG: hypothetical protein Q9195_008822 [Heterodermia aff. obscurata]
MPLRFQCERLFFCRYLRSITTIVLLIASFSAAKPILDIQKAGSRTIAIDQRNLPYSLSLRHVLSPDPRLAPNDNNFPRALTDLPNPIQNGMISRTHYTKLGTMVPIAVAAQNLEAFYESIAAQVHSWLNTPEYHEFIITQGRLQLSFICSRADVPWNFVAAFAEFMADNVSKGWVEVYDSVWENPARTIVNGLFNLTTIFLGFLSSANVILASPTSKAIGILKPHPYEQKSSRNPSHNPLKAMTNNVLSITPRADPFGVLPITSLQPGWELDFYDYDWGYLPLASASNVLQIFYSKIFEFAVSASGPFPDHAVLSLGQLDLEVVSNSGTVAWESVAAFAAHMLQTARRGYTNSYHCHMANMAAGVSLSFNLYVRAVRQLPAKIQ